MTITYAFEAESAAEESRYRRVLERIAEQFETAAPDGMVTMDHKQAELASWMIALGASPECRKLPGLINDALASGETVISIRLHDENGPCLAQAIRTGMHRHREGAMRPEDVQDPERTDA